MRFKQYIGHKIYSFMRYNNYGFSEDKYWKMRDVAMNSQKHILQRILALRYVNKTNIKFGASIYTELDKGCVFESKPILPHQLNGIIIASTAHIGKNVTILHQVTIGGNPKKYDGSSPVSQAPTIEDNVIIGAGAKVIGNVRIGHDSIIGANAVVVSDIPENCVAVGIPAYIVKRKKDE